VGRIDGKIDGQERASSGIHARSDHANRSGWGAAISEVIEDLPGRQTNGGRVRTSDNSGVQVAILRIATQRDDQVQSQNG